MDQKRAGTVGCIGCLGLIVLLVGIGVLLPKRDSSNVPSKPALPTATKLQSERSKAPRESSVGSLSDGDIGRIVGTVPCGATKEALDEIYKWGELRDKEEFIRTIAKTGSVIAEPGMQAKVLDRGIIRTKVRLLDSGTECWIYSDRITGR